MRLALPSLPLWPFVVAASWLAVGMLGYLFWEARHARWRETRFSRPAASYFPRPGDGLVVALLGPFTFLTGALVETFPIQPPARDRSAAASRERPELPVLEEEPDELADGSSEKIARLR